MKYLISDCDGVLIDSEIIAARVMVQYLNEFGVPITLNEYLQNCSGKTFSGLLTSFSREYCFTLPENALQVAEDRHMTIAEKELQVIKGTKDAYKAIPLPKAVVSNGWHRHIEMAVKFAQMEDMFEGGIFSAVEVVPNPKPAPDVYIYAAEKVGVDPKDVVVIEDSKSGVISGVAAGMNVIGFTGASHILDGHDEILLELGAKAVISDMKELPELVKKL
ncbi:HAD-IA family hydrolase [Limibacter armeniacum]|uniref:HAD family hydrolase n=1 Tax=Limibacter armeniacum TaxID=466084 RepID=UPI002FE6A273